MDIKDLSDKDCIHCPTLEEALELCKLLHSRGLRWCTGKSYININSWKEYRENMIYIPHMGMMGSLDYATRNRYNIYKASDFFNIKHELW